DGGTKRCRGTFAIARSTASDRRARPVSSAVARTSATMSRTRRSRSLVYGSSAHVTIAVANHMGARAVTTKRRYAVIGGTGSLCIDHSTPGRLSYFRIGGLMQARECARHRFEVMVCADLLEQFPGTLERACRMIAVFGGSALQRSHGESMVGARLVIR